MPSLIDSSLGFIGLFCIAGITGTIKVLSIDIIKVLPTAKTSISKTISKIINTMHNVKVCLFSGVIF
jgi:hypothetical protein